MKVNNTTHVKLKAGDSNVLRNAMLHVLELASGGYESVNATPSDTLEIIERIHPELPVELRLLSLQEEVDDYLNRSFDVEVIFNGINKKKSSIMKRRTARPRHERVSRYRSEMLEMFRHRLLQTMSETELLGKLALLRKAIRTNMRGSLIDGKIAVLHFQILVDWNLGGRFFVKKGKLYLRQVF